MPLDHEFVVSDWMLPTNGSEARALGVDLDGKAGGAVDNSVGFTLATFAAQGLVLGDGLTARTNDGSFILLLNVQTETPPDTRANVLVFSGANPEPAACENPMDPVCRHHLDGSASFTASRTPGGSPVLVGSLAATGAVDAQAASWEVPFNLTGTQLLLPVEKARVLLTMRDGAVTAGRIAGALPMTWVKGTLFPTMVADFELIIERDCTATTSPPGCGCADGSVGKTLLGLFDTSHDCALTEAELEAFPGGWVPDIDVNGDGTNDALSFGFGFSGVAAHYTVP